MILQVVMLPSPGDDIARILASLGESLPRIFNREGLERQAILDRIAADPTYGQQIASQVRATSAEGAVNAGQPGLSSVGETLGLDMGNPDSQALLAEIARSFPATLQEQVGALATGATAGAAASPLAEETFTAAMAGAQAETQGALTSIITAMNEEERQRFLNDFNFPRLAAQYDMVTAELGIEDAQQKLDAWKMLDDFVAANPELAGPEAAGLANPAFLSYLSLLQQLSVQEQLSMAKKAADPLDALASIVSLGQERNKLWNSIQEAKKNDASDQEIAALNAQWNDVESTGQLIADAIPGLTWSTITLPGQEKDPLTYSIGRKWTEYTTTFKDAEQADIVDTQLDLAIRETAARLYHLTPGSPEYTQERSRAIAEIMASDLGPHIKASQLKLEEIYAAIDEMVKSQVGAATTETEVNRGTSAVLEDIERRTRIPR